MLVFPPVISTRDLQYQVNHYLPSAPVGRRSVDLPCGRGGLEPEEAVAGVVLVTHVAQRAEVKVEALGTLPAHPLHALCLAPITDNVGVLHT